MERKEKKKKPPPAAVIAMLKVWHRLNKQKQRGASVKILGSGCTKCNQLETAVKAALEQLNMDASIDHITDFSQIAAYGVMTTPALVVDGKVVSYGKVLKVDEAVKILNRVRS